jgi:hypothetical protein
LDLAGLAGLVGHENHNAIHIRIFATESALIEKPSEIAEEIVVQNTPTGPKVAKMEQAPTISPAEEKQPVRPLKDGYLDDVCSIFKARQHPIVLVEESAMRWMGVRVSSEEVNITSSSRLPSVALTLTNSGFRLIDQRL